MKKQPERTNATRAAFVDAFAELNRQKSIEKITVQELAEKAGYNRATFYEYFGDIYGLLSYIEDLMAAYIEKVVVSRIGNLPGHDVFADLFADICREQEKYIAILLSEQNYTRFSQKLKARLIPVFSAKLELPCSETTAVYLLDFYLSGIISLLARWFTSEERLPVDEFAVLLRRIVGKMGTLFEI